MTDDDWLTFKNYQQPLPMKFKVGRVTFGTPEGWAKIKAKLEDPNYHMVHRRRFSWKRLQHEWVIALERKTPA